MSHYNNLQEEELKIRIAEQFFTSYDCGNRIGKIDFCVTQIQDAKHVIAGEACLAPTEGTRNGFVALGGSQTWRYYRYLQAPRAAHSHHW